MLCYKGCGLRIVVDVSEDAVERGYFRMLVLKPVPRLAIDNVCVNGNDTLFLEFHFDFICDLATGLPIFTYKG